MSNINGTVHTVQLGVEDPSKLSDRNTKSGIVSVDRIFVSPKTTETSAPPPAPGACKKHRQRKDVGTEWE